MRTNVFARAFFAELRDEHDVDDAVFLVDGAAPPKTRAHDTASISETNATEIETVSNVSFGR